MPWQKGFDTEERNVYTPLRKMIIKTSMHQTTSIKIASYKKAG